MLSRKMRYCHIETYGLSDSAPLDAYGWITCRVTYCAFFQFRQLWRPGGSESKTGRGPGLAGGVLPEDSAADADPGEYDIDQVS